jgi:hypothetical protein
MALCISSGCKAMAKVGSNYCSTHQPRLSTNARITQDSAYGDSASRKDRKEGTRSKPKEPNRSGEGNKGGGGNRDR